MKKKVVVFSIMALLAANVFAYNPPFGGEISSTVTNPVLLMGGDSATAGADYNVVPGTIVFNPAITAFEQRTMLNLSYTSMFDTNKASTDDPIYGQGFQAGVIIPTKYAVFTGVVNGLFTSFPRMNLGDSITLHLGASKEVISERLSVGMNLYTGFYFLNGSDFTVGVDLGALYKFDDMGFLKDPRLGVALLNLGKPLGDGYTVTGIDGTTSDINYPGIVTPRVSFASTLFDVKNFTGAFSADLSFPFFQNVVFDTSVAFTAANIVTLSVSWDANVRELVAGSKVSLPSVGLAFKFSINTGSFAKASQDWAQSEITPSLAWENLYDGIQAISVGATLDLGMKDTSAPEITIVFDDGEELITSTDEDVQAFVQWEEDQEAAAKAKRAEEKARAKAEAEAVKSAEENSESEEAESASESAETSAAE